MSILGHLKKLLRHNRPVLRCPRLIGLLDFHFEQKIDENIGLPAGDDPWFQVCDVYLMSLSLLKRTKE